MPYAPRRNLTLLVSLTAICGAGCARTLVERPTPTSYDASITQERVGFWHALAGRSAITNDEGLHALLLFIEGEDPTTTYEERLAYTKSLGLIDDGFDEPASIAMQKGTLAQGLVRGLDIKGGVMLAATHQHPRYATKELQYLGIMGGGTELRVISGLELLGVMSNAQAWREINRPAPADEPAPPEPPAQGAEPDGDG